MAEDVQILDYRLAVKMADRKLAEILTQWQRSTGVYSAKEMQTIANTFASWLWEERRDVQTAIEAGLPKYPDDPEGPDGDGWGIELIAHLDEFIGAYSEAFTLAMNYDAEDCGGWYPARITRKAVH